MQTYSHLLINAVLRGPLAKRKRLATGKPSRLPSFRSSAFLCGAILPDLPLILTTVVCLTLDKLAGISFTTTESLSQGSYTKTLFDDWFFNNPWVIFEQNIFHSPTSLIIFLGVCWWLWKRGVDKAVWFFWLMAGCLVHTTLDIPVHHDDGPLIFFPFNWDYRYMSPLSYWDAARYGRQFAIFEHLLDIVLIAYLCLQWRRWRMKRRQSN